MRKFHDDNHANNRLSRCYALCRDGNGKWKSLRIERATLNDVIMSDGSVYNLDNEEDFIFMFPRLGYVNTKHQAIHITRSSKRMWKVGLVRENVIATAIHPGYFGVDGEGRFKIEDYLEDLHFNKYPDFNKCLKQIKDGKAAARAFSRDFCLGLHTETKDVVLYYRNLPIGHYDDREKAVIIGDVNSHYVQKFLEVVDGKVEVLV